MKQNNLKMIRLSTPAKVSTTFEFMMQLYSINKRKSLQRKEVRIENVRKVGVRSFAV